MAELGSAAVTPLFAALYRGTAAKLITAWRKPSASRAFIKSGTNRTVISNLAACLSGLIPLPQYDDALKIDAALYPTYDTVFLSNAMGPLVPTTTVSVCLLPLPQCLLLMPG